jgi:hypothetical protein
VLFVFRTFRSYRRIGRSRRGRESETDVFFLYIHKKKIKKKCYDRILFATTTVGTLERAQGIFS